MNLPQQSKVRGQSTTNRVRRRARHGLTLIEMMISVALTLLVVFAIVRVFDMLGSSVGDSRAVLEMSAGMRTISNQLQQDLDRVTVPMTPPIDPNAGGGYFEYIEGIGNDYDSNGNGQANLADNDATDILGDSDNQNSGLGDIDDMLMMTIRSRGKPFTGRFNGTTIESNIAEVIWWVQVDPANNTIRQIHRKLLLVRPDLSAHASVASVDFNVPFDRSNPNSAINFYLQNDVSISPITQVGNTSRILPTGATVKSIANSLSDLTKRENRFAHNPLHYPHVLVGTRLENFAEPQVVPISAKSFVQIENEARMRDVVLNDVLAFDVRVFDPLAPIDNISSPVVALTPGDIGYVRPTTNVFPRGAYVDLNYGGPSIPLINAVSNFAGQPHVKSLPRTPNGTGPYHVRRMDNSGNLVEDMRPPYAPTYCTWSTHYERDGMDQDRDGFVDQGTDGLPLPYKNGRDQNGIDDATEMEAPAPYPHKLRGIEVRIRMIEISSRQVRQVSVVSDFTPE